MTGVIAGRYRVLDRLGEGGMGVVFRAEDMRLGRQVALKFLPEQEKKDRQSLDRFKLEAQAASSLNHPNICTIYDVGEHDGRPFIAMEFLEGRTLRETITANRVETEQLMRHGVQLADALAAAHAKGIIHRDIKPGNIFVTQRGDVKILDFGLAKLTSQLQARPGDDTLPLDLTNPGDAVGTVAYMSPEQARGEPLDARTDLFSLGVVLYEMAAGVPPFRGATTAVVFDEIQHGTPNLSKLPKQVEPVIAKALEKDRELRYQSAAELRSDLKRADRTSAVVHPVHSLRARGSIVAVSILATTTLAALGWYLATRRSGGPSLKNAIFTQLTHAPGEESYPCISPDGTSFVYASRASGNWDIYLQRIGGRNPVNLTKDSAADETQPVFSSDGERIAFRSERDGGGIFVMGATGESVRRVADFGYYPAWSPNGKEIVFATEGFVDPSMRGVSKSRLVRVNVSTGERMTFTPEKGDAVQPHWSPHGHRLAYWSSLNGQRDVYTIAATGGDPRPITSDAALDWNPVWSPDGLRLYFVSDRGGSMNLWRVAVDEQSGRVLGPPESLTTPSPYSGNLSITRDGRHLTYVQRIESSNIYKLSFDPIRARVTGAPIALTEGSRLFRSPSRSPDDKWIAFCSGGRQEDLFVVRVDGSGLRNLTDDPHRDRLPRWSPDGKDILFYSNRSGEFQVWTIRPDGSGLRQLTFERTGANEAAWSPDGSRIAYISHDAGAYVMDATRPWREQQRQKLSDMDEADCLFKPNSWSPDGQKLAGLCFAPTGDRGVYVYSLASGTYAKLAHPAGWATWLSDSRTLLFRQRSSLQLADSQTGKIREIFSGLTGGIWNVTVDVSADNRTIYYSAASIEGDVWLVSLQ